MGFVGSGWEDEVAMDIDLLVQEYKDMTRDVYDQRLMEQLQIQNNAFEEFVTVTSVETGKSLETNTMGKFEMDIRTQRFEAKKKEQAVFGKRFINPVALCKAVTMSKDDLKIAGVFQAGASQYFRQLAHAAGRAKMMLILGIIWDAEKKIYRVPTAEEAEQGAGQYSVDTLYSKNGVPLQGILGTCFGGLNGSKKLELAQKPMGTDGELIEDYLTSYTEAGMVDLETTSVIPANYVHTGKAELSNLTLAKVRAVVEALKWRNVVQGDELVNLAVTPSQMTALIMEDKLQNSLYSLTRSIDRGTVNTALGVRFIETNMLPMHDLGDGKLVRINPAWVTEDVELAVWSDIETDIYREREQNWDGIVMTCEFIAGAARKREESVVCIHNAEKKFAA